MRRLALSETARQRLARVAVWVLIAVIVVCVVIVLIALIKQGRWTPRINYPTTRSTTTTPIRPAVYYKNCDEAHADGRWDIPEGDPAYRPGLDKDHNGVACESRHR